jgi:2-methylcitrate dehydratase
MSDPAHTEAPDEIAALIADYAANAPGELDPQTECAARAVLVDSLAVAMGALPHPAAQAARAHAGRFRVDGGCAVWGTSTSTTPEMAALVNGVLLRCYDYNDFFVGDRNSGHGSDMVSGVIAAAEWKNERAGRLLAALAVGYDVVGAAYDAFSTAAGGWDYTNLTAIGATCAIARVLGLGAAEMREALAMTVIPHFASDEIESGDLNARGDLTMWKRFNGADAVRNSLQACLLASVGVEGAVRPFTGRLGFVQKLAGKRDEVVDVLRARLDCKHPPARIRDTYFKRWPVGSLAQSAIQAALLAREKVGEVAQIKEVRVFAEEGAYEHLVKVRQDPWHPVSRETADHSLPYIVAAAVLDGYVRSESFEPARVLDPVRQRFLADKIKVSPAPELGTLAGGKLKRARAGYLSRVEIETMDGTVVHGDAAPFPGHPRNPYSDRDLADKLRENMRPVAGEVRTEQLVGFLDSLSRASRVRELTGLLAFDAAPSHPAHAGEGWVSGQACGDGGLPTTGASP